MRPETNISLPSQSQRDQEEREKLWTSSQPERTRRAMKVLGVAAMVLMAGAVYKAASRRAARYREVNTPFRFPVAELALLDRDVQARFAVVPTKSFGLGRIGPMHHLYTPQTPAEKQTIAALHKREVDAAFYVMSRRTWRNEQGPEGFYPIQGPVYITRVLSDPMPRKQLFNPSFAPGFKRGQRVEEPPDVRQFDPEGTPAPLSLPPDKLPEGRQLRALGDQVFDRAQEALPTSQPGLVSKLGARGWRVAAVPVRASDPACVNCHNGWNWVDKTAIKQGDAVGVAFYVYRVPPWRESEN